MPSSIAAIKRLSAQYAAIEKGDRHLRDLYAAPLKDNIFEWHFTIIGPQKDNCPYAKGIYHGRLKFPLTYPFDPPDVYFLTPNGRFETNTKVCTSVSSFHKEGWRPSYDAIFILSSLRLYMQNYDDIGVGGIYKNSLSDEQRVKMAEKSWNFVCAQCNESRPMKQLYEKHMSSGENNIKDKMIGKKKEEQTQQRETTTTTTTTTTLAQNSNSHKQSLQLKRQQQQQQQEMHNCQQQNIRNNFTTISTSQQCDENKQNKIANKHDNLTNLEKKPNVSGNNVIDINTNQLQENSTSAHASEPEDMMLRLTIHDRVVNIPLKYLVRFA